MRKEGAFIVLFRNDQRNEIFLVRRSDYYIWDLTGGGIESDEDPETAAVREAREETGFRVESVRLIGTYTYLKNNEKILGRTHLFEGMVVSGEFQPEFPGCKGAWFSINKIPMDITKSTRRKINDTINFSGQVFNKQASEAKVTDNIHLMLLHPVSTIRFLLRRRSK